MLVPCGNYLQRISKRDLCRIEFPSRVYKDTKQIDLLTGELWSVDRLVVNADRNALKSDLQASMLATAAKKIPSK